MSMYYNPEIVKLLMAERIKEAQDARLGSRLKGHRPAARILELATRPFGTIHHADAAPSTCSC